LEPHEKSLQARKLPELLLDLPGWRVDPPGKMPASPWQTYVSEVRRVVTETLGDPFRRPSMENLHRKLQFASNQYKDSLDRSDEEFAVTFSTQHMASNIPRNLLEGDLDWSSERDAAILRTKIEEWIREATEIQYAPQGYTLANAFATETAERSTIMVVGPEVVFFAAYQQEGAGRTSNERLLRLNFTVNRIHVALAPVANDERVAWPRNVRVFPSSELNTATTKQAIAECKEWAPLIRKASMVAQSISADALLALATWRFHLRLSRVFKKLLDFPVNISAAGDKTQLVLDKTAFDKILDNPLCRMVFGQGHPQRFFAAELKRWHDELTAGSGKLQLRNRNSGHRFDIAIHEIKEHQVFVDAFGKRRSWPEKGVLHYAENAGVNVAHQRQEAGVGALMSNHRILRRLVDGEQHSAVRITASPELKTMQQALDNLKSSWPVSAVNGPPGTGKTTLMANLVREILEDDPAARILLTSQSHAAVDNAMERISSELELAGETSASLPLVRSFSAFTRSKVSNNSLRNHDIKAFVKRARDRAIGSAKDESSGNKSLTKARKKLHEAAEESTNEWERRIERSAPLVATTTSGASLAGDYQRSRSNRWDWVLCDEAGRAFGIELAQPMAVAQRLVLTGDYRQLPPYQIEVIEEAIKKIHSRVQNGHFDNLDMDMLRIGDSAASKDAALNWLVPFKRLMTMGDPFRPDIGSEDPGIVPVTQELSTQYRSYRAIGDLVSDAFYKGEVRTYEGEVRHGVNVSETPDEAVLPLGSGRHDPVLCWVDTSSWEDRHENRTAGLSLRNRLEAQVAAALAARLFENLERDDPDCLRDPRQLAEYIRILSPYAAQVAEIRNALERGFLKPKERLRAFRDTVLGTVGTVDSAQGAEATICIYSWVRSTPYQRIPDNDSSVAAWEAALRQQFGFLLKRERMNVLMSRAREQIVIVGDRKHFDQFMALHEGLKKAVEGSESEHTINPKEIVFWTDLLKAFDPEKDWKNGRRVIPLDELGLDP